MEFSLKLFYCYCENPTHKQNQIVKMPNDPPPRKIGMCKNCFRTNTLVFFIPVSRLALVAELDAPSDWRPGGRGFNPLRGRQHSYVEIDHEIFSTVILSLPLIQEGQLSVSGKECAQY